MHQVGNKVTRFQSGSSHGARKRERLSSTVPEVCPMTQAEVTSLALEVEFDMNYV
jgi:hypothetical protein